MSITSIQYCSSNVITFVLDSIAWISNIYFFVYCAKRAPLIDNKIRLPWLINGTIRLQSHNTINKYLFYYFLNNHLKLLLSLVGIWWHATAYCCLCVVYCWWFSFLAARNIKTKQQPRLNNFEETVIISQSFRNTSKVFACTLSLSLYLLLSLSPSNWITFLRAVK